MARYLVAYIDPQTGKEALGTGPSAQTVARYASVKNIIRYHLSKEAFPPGQYNIYTWPEGTFGPHFVQTAYKRV